MSIEQNKAVVRRFITDVLTGGDPGVIDELLAPAYRNKAMGDADLAIFKNISLNEARYIQFRLETFNFTNTATFATPHMTYGASNFGVIDRYAGGRGPRELQIAVKFYF